MQYEHMGMENQMPITWKAARYMVAAVLFPFSASSLLLALITAESALSCVTGLVIGLGLPFVAAGLLPQGRSYWARLCISFLCVAVSAPVMYFLMPLIVMMLMDSGLM
jgi:hypothetical protein